VSKTSKKQEVGKKLAEYMEKEMQTTKPCILCGRPTFNRALFFPKNSQEFGAPVGKRRVFIYALCDFHPEDEITAEQVEEVISSYVKEKLC